jgi:hypothetical protein
MSWYGHRWIKAAWTKQWRAIPDGWGSFQVVDETQSANPCRAKHSLASRGRILFELWQRGIHLIPGVRIRGPDIHLRIEPARII